MNIYNDNDPKVCAWASELVRQGHVAPGSVLCKSIKEVQADELRQATQVHLFAGILGWPLALRLAGWPDDRPVWTGSCPCQPFSAAGKRKGTADERHLWPDMLRLIAECRPECVVGEQVASAVGHGWLDGVFADLEAEGYSCGAVVLGAHSIGAPHIRQRLFWVADAKGPELPRLRPVASGQQGRLADGGGVGNASDQGPQRHGRPVKERRAEERQGEERHATTPGLCDWSRSVIIPCGDGKARRIEPSITPLAHGIPARVVRLRGYGNAIVPQVAAAFVRAFMESRTEAA